jgi:hypothetical protein
MNAVKQLITIALGVAFALPSSSSLALQVTGELGSPTATSTVSGKQLPPPGPKFGGVIKRTAWEGPELSAGKHTIVFDFKFDGPGLGKGGTGVLSVDGKEVARNSMEHTTPVMFPEDEDFDVGQDTLPRWR